MILAFVVSLHLPLSLLLPLHLPLPFFLSFPKGICFLPLRVLPDEQGPQAPEQAPNKMGFSPGALVVASSSLSSRGAAEGPPHWPFTPAPAILSAIPEGTRFLPSSLHARPLYRILPVALVLASLCTRAQDNQQPPTNNPPPTTNNQQPTQPHGDVLFQSHGEPPVSPEDTTAPALQQSAPTDPTLSSREALTSYDLDVRITPDASRLSSRARVTLRNISSQPLPRVALQISSSLSWESIALITPQSTTQLPLTQHLIDTDADHTGQASEAILDLPTPLAPGATLTLDTLYSGTITPNATRLERIGATLDKALDTDWDTLGITTISSNSSSSSSSSNSADAAPNTLAAALRGFGNVLWYPVASPPLFLGDGAKLFQAVAAMRLAQQADIIHLRLAVEYKGEPPVAAYFCGRRQPLAAHADNPNAPIAEGSGIATANFASEPLGFRQPNLFLVELAESLIAPLPQATSSSASTPTADTAPSTGGAPMLAVDTANEAALPPLATSAQKIAPLLQLWFGERPLTALTILDHAGEPFEDGPLLVAPIEPLSSSASAPALAHSLAHAWVQTGQPWIDEGLAQFTSLLWIEQEQGRDAALLQLNNLIQPLNIAEVGFDTEQAADASSALTGQPLISASDELYYRRKAAAVWWMLRGITGDLPLQQALAAWRTQPPSHDNPTVQAIGFEKLLEKTSGKDLSWFFSDWVLRDRGLPDLSIVNVEPRQLPAGKGHDSGWLVAVTMHNAGAPAVDVPLIIRSGTFSTTTRIHIPGFSDVTDRIVVEAAPTQVVLNDGSTPEIRASTHSRDIVQQPDNQ